MTREEAAEELSQALTDEVIAAHEQIAYDRGFRDGYAEAIEVEPIKHGTVTLTYEEYGELCSYALAYEKNHGEWLIDKSGSLMCSKCGTLLDEAQKPSRYCPNCGASMMDEVEG